MRIVLGLVLGSALVGVAFAGTPFGGDDTGFLPTSKKDLICEAKAQLLAARLVRDLAKCHATFAAAALAGTASAQSEEQCDDLAEGHFLGKSSELIERGLCSPCVVHNINIQPYAYDVKQASDAANGDIYCDGTTPLGDDDAGVVPPTVATLKCEAAVAKGLTQLQLCLAKCHARYAKTLLAGGTFDEDACEDTDPLTSCRAKWNALRNKLAPQCPSCLDAAAQNGLADHVQATVDGGNDTFYCASPGGAFVD